MSAPPDEPGGTDDRTGDSPEPFDSRSTDEAFEAIVAGIRHGDPPPEVPVWPAIEDASPSESPEPEPEPSPALGSQWTGWEDVANNDEEMDADQAEADGDEGEFIPPPPPPIPRGDPVLRWAWVGAVGSPLAAVALGAAGWSFDGLVGLGLVAAFFAGFITLVSRLRTGVADEDNPDDGAVV